MGKDNFKAVDIAGPKGDDKTARPRYFIQSLESGLVILQSFAGHSTPLALTEIAQIVGKNLPTTSRFLKTLIDLGYLVVDRSTKKYSLTPKVMSLGLSYLHNLDLRSRVHPHLVSINNDFKASAQCAILDGIEIILVERLAATGFVDFNLTAGSRLPTYCTGLGRAILAYLEPDQRLELVERIELKPRTSFTITDKGLFLEELERTRERGYGLNLQEMTIGFCNVAAPVFNNGKVEGALAASFPVEFMEKDDFFEVMIKRIVDAGARSSL